MAEISRAALFGKLNKIAYKAIDSATVFCKLRGNPSVELTHWIHQILQLQDSDLHRILKQYACNPARIAEGITDALERLPRGASAVDLSSNVEEAVERGWVYATLMFGEAQVRTGYLIVGIYLTASLFWGARAGANPWHATGLEWTTQSPPLPHNFETQPVVTEEAYEYSKREIEVV